VLAPGAGVLAPGVDVLAAGVGVLAPGAAVLAARVGVLALAWVCWRPALGCRRRASAYRHPASACGPCGQCVGRPRQQTRHPHRPTQRRRGPTRAIVRRCPHRTVGRSPSGPRAHRARFTFTRPSSIFTRASARFRKLGYCDLRHLVLSRRATPAFGNASSAASARRPDAVHSPRMNGATMERANPSGRLQAVYRQSDISGGRAGYVLVNARFLRTPGSPGRVKNVERSRVDGLFAAPWHRRSTSTLG
jgi:hypothetical protein